MDLTHHPAVVVLNELLDRYESSTAFQRGEPTARRIQVSMNDTLIEGYRSGGIDPDVRRTLHSTLMEWQEARVIALEWERFEQGNLLRRVLLEWVGIVEAYRLVGRRPKVDWLQAVEAQLSSYSGRLTAAWMKNWIDDVREQLTDRRSIPDSLLPADDTRRQLLFDTLAGLCDKGDESLPMRVFSKRYLKNSKLFERDVRSRLSSLLRHYATSDNPALEAVDGFVDSDTILLSEVGIEVSHHDIAFCGPIVLELSGGQAGWNDGRTFPFGLALDADVVVQMEIVSLPVSRVLTIENRANFRHYVRNERQQDELVVYLGGFPSPAMRLFLRALGRVADKSNTRDNGLIEFTHWGDLDYGGILIAQVLRDTVTPTFNTWRMEPEWLDRMADYVEPFTHDYRVKLERLLEDPRYQAWWPLVQKLLDVGGTLEQEAFLI